jgi:hypothetical protein
MLSRRIVWWQKKQLSDRGGYGRIDGPKAAAIEVTDDELDRAPTVSH